MARFVSPIRNQVLVIVPPNTNTVLEGRLLTVTRPQEHSDWSDFMSLGALGLVCALGENPNLRPMYVDGTVIGLDQILAYISGNGDSILAVCVGVLTANYEAGMLILRHAKETDARIWTLVGNDHFTALPAECMLRSECIDFGFFGNEVVYPFARLVGDLYLNKPIASDAYPSLVTRSGDSIRTAPWEREPVFSHYDYRLIDSLLDHEQLYTDGFQRRVAPRIKELLGRTVEKGVPVDIGRGCVKFAKNNACSFCSIQYGGLWKNELGPQAAWQTIRCAWESGYDYLYVTADELPLTFGPLLTAMSGCKPDWWRDLPEGDRPVIVGYARADGIADVRRTRLLIDLGVRQVMIGMDAGSATSLAAMNKPVQIGRDDLLRNAESLFAENTRAIKVAREEGLLIRAGFVLGHLGLTPELLKENVERIMELIGAGRDVISAIDIEVLSPQPGSLDFNYLTMPGEATATAHRLGLDVCELPELEHVAAKWRGQDVIVPELAMRDYTSALMPGVQFSQLADSRAAVRAFAKSCGVVIGE